MWKAPGHQALPGDGRGTLRGACGRKDRPGVGTADPEHEGQGGVENQISQGLTQTKLQQVILKPVADSEGEEGEDEVEKVIDEVAHRYFVYQCRRISVGAVVDDGNQEEER